VGSKGELFPPKAIRERLGLRPRVRVIFRVDGGRLVVEPIPSIEEVLKEPQPVEVTLEELRRTRDELSRKAES